MKSSELRDMSDEELSETEASTVTEYFRLRFQHHTGQLVNTAQLAEVRRSVGRIKTIRRERTRVAASGE